MDAWVGEESFFSRLYWTISSKNKLKVPKVNKTKTYIREDQVISLNLNNLFY